MDSKVTNVLHIVLVVCVVYTSWTVATLRADVETMQFTQQGQGNQCSVNLQAMNQPLLQIQKNQVSISGGVSYAELLLEGIARNAGLPLAQARSAFEARTAGVPAGWTWLATWETQDAQAAEAAEALE